MFDINIQRVVLQNHYVLVIFYALKYRIHSLNSPRDSVLSLKKQSRNQTKHLNIVGNAY